MRDKDRSGGDRHRDHQAGLQDLVERRAIRSLNELVEVPPAQPPDEAMEGAAACGSTVLDVCADHLQALAKAAANSAHGQPEPRGYLAIRQAGKVGELDHLPMLGGQLADGLVDRLTGHGAREVNRPGRSAQQDVLDAVIHAASAAPVDRRLPGPGGEPGSP